MSNNDSTLASQTAKSLIERNIRSIADLEAEVRSSASLSDRIALAISRFCGSMVFVWVHVAFFASWILLNTVFLPKPFDPYPFTFLTFVVSLEAIFLSTFIMIAENRQEQINERRGKLDLQINLLAEQESTKTLKLLQAVAQKMDVSVDDKSDGGELEEETQPEHLAREIEREDQRSGK